MNKHRFNTLNNQMIDIIDQIDDVIKAKVYAAGSIAIHAAFGSGRVEVVIPALWVDKGEVKLTRITTIYDDEIHHIKEILNLDSISVDEKFSVINALYPNYL